jgi:hypothetical protein
VSSAFAAEEAKLPLGQPVVSLSILLPISLSHSNPISHLFFAHIYLPIPRSRSIDFRANPRFSLEIGAWSDSAERGENMDRTSLPTGGFTVSIQFQYSRLICLTNRHADTTTDEADGYLLSDYRLASKAFSAIKHCISSA